MKKYEPVSLEEDVLKYWKKNKTETKSNKKREGKKTFSFIEGPPTLNAGPHVGHFRGRALKDVILRYKQLKGFDVRKRAGWDCQGLPVELMVEKDLGFKTKHDIEKYGIDKFNRKCKERVLKFHEVWEKASKRIGMWMDWENAYWTMNNEYIEMGWAVVKKAHQDRILKEDYRVIHWCPRCETALSQHEVSQGYETVNDKSIYVKLKTKNNDYLIIWTTTPWTMPENMAVMAHPNLDYVKVKVGKENWILAKELANKLVDNPKIIETFKGKKLKGLEYEHPFSEIPYHKTHTPKVVLSKDYVTLEQGSGLVHCAPGCGPEDYEVGKENQIEAFNPVGENGIFGEDAGEYKGLHAIHDNYYFAKKLEEKGLLVKTEVYEHEYPHCWRCGTKLIFIMSNEWFFDADKVRDKMVKTNQKVNWYPDWTKKRFGDWLAGAKDWNISRKRYWGTPLPIWKCECGNMNVIGSVKELEKHAGKKLGLTDLHRPHVDKISWDCKCGKKMKRVEHVGDVWLDSGVSPGVTFEYLKDKKTFNKWFPADFITEATDQTRGWYYTLMFANTVMFNKCPYKHVLNQGHMLDDKGKKMSKSKGNVVWFEDAMKKTGADIYRYFVLWKAAMWNSVNYDEQEIKLVYRMLNSYWNMHNLLQLNNKKLTKPKTLEYADKWLNSRTNTVIKEFAESMEKYDVTQATRVLYDFVLEEVSRFYIQSARTRMKGDDKNTVFYTLSNALKTITQLLSPITPFITEQVYQNLKGMWNEKEESVHHLNWPKTGTSDVKIEKEMKIVNELVEQVLAIRNEHGIRVRWPVQTVYTKTRLTPEAKNVVKEMCNCLEVKLVKEKPKGTKGKQGVYLDLKVTPKLKELGLLREITRQIQAYRKQKGYKVGETKEMTYESEKLGEIIEKNKEELFKLTSTKLTAGQGEKAFKVSFHAETHEIKLK